MTNSHNVARAIALVVVLATLLVSVPARACEFCVREVGFVPVFDEPYRVVLAVDERTSEADRRRRHDRALEVIGAANVVLESANTNTAESVSVVHSPDGRTRGLEPGNGTLDDLRRLVDSPARRGLAEALADGYATVMLVEGDDSDANEAARAVARAAITRINDEKDGFDRVIEVGPGLRVVRAGNRADERWLLWSMGIEVDADEPVVAVLYGRGRRLGDVLRGETLTEAELFRLLGYVARNCERSLDKQWLYGRPIPLAWTDGIRARVRRELGFDPEGAATLAEVSRILRRRGPGPGPRDPFSIPNVERTGIVGLRIIDLAAPTATSDVVPAPTVAPPPTVAPAPTVATTRPLDPVQPSLFVACGAGVVVLVSVFLCATAGRHAR